MSPYSGSCVRIFLDRKNWTEARKSCNAKGGELLRISHRRMNEFVASLVFPGMGDVYIGLRKYWNRYWWEGKKLLRADFRSVTGKGRTGRLHFTPTGSLTWMMGDDTTARSYFCEKGPALCPQDWNTSPFSGTCVKLFLKRVDYQTATDTCLSHNAQLVVMLTPDMNDFVWDLFKGTGVHMMYIGLNDLETPGKYVWLNGWRTPDFLPWILHEPDLTLNHDCGYIFHKNPREWGDTHCDFHTNFICERFSDCKNEKYGMVCPYECNNTHCLNKTCDVRTGECRYGCEEGYTDWKCDFYVETIFKFDYIQIIIMGLICIALICPCVCCLACFLERSRDESVEVCVLAPEDKALPPLVDPNDAVSLQSSFADARISDLGIEDPKIAPYSDTFSLTNFTSALTNMTNMNFYRSYEQGSKKGSNESE